MIKFTLDFIQNNIMVLSLLLTIVVVLFVVSKYIRRIIYALISSGVLTLFFLILYKLGLGFESVYEFVNKFLYTISDYLSEIQAALFRCKNILSFANAIKSYAEITSVYAGHSKELYSLPILFISSFITEVEVEFITLATTVKEVVVKKIKLSTYSFVYRC